MTASCMHIGLASVFECGTNYGLLTVEKHNFLILIFEVRELVDVGDTVQKQHHGGAPRLSKWAEIVNLSILGGNGIVEALDQTVTA